MVSGSRKGRGHCQQNEPAKGTKRGFFCSELTVSVGTLGRFFCWRLGSMSELVWSVNAGVLY